MITEFGKELRKLRLDCGEILKDMALKLNISSAYLSAIECGKREIPKNFMQKLKEHYDITPEREEILNNAYNLSLNTITLNLKGANKDEKELALKFARKFLDMDEITRKQIAESLSKMKNEKND